MKLPIQAAPVIRGSIQNTIRSRTKMYSASGISPSVVCIPLIGNCFQRNTTNGCGFPNNQQTISRGERVVRQQPAPAPAAPAAQPNLPLNAQEFDAVQGLIRLAQ